MKETISKNRMDTTKVFGKDKIMFEYVEGFFSQETKKVTLFGLNTTREKMKVEYDNGHVRTYDLFSDYGDEAIQEGFGKTPLYRALEYHWIRSEEDVDTYLFYDDGREDFRILIVFDNAITVSVTLKWKFSNKLFNKYFSDRDKVNNKRPFTIIPHPHEVDDFLNRMYTLENFPFILILHRRDFDIEIDNYWEEIHIVKKICTDDEVSK